MIRGELGSYGVSNPEFYQLTQSQYETAREILIKHFADSIQPSADGDYFIDHPEVGWNIWHIPMSDTVGNISVGKIRLELTMLWLYS